jgi:wyosine [tRNA(Phe)-imidazoG37] synthetase (radical SAM superfamily)
MTTPTRHVCNFCCNFCDVGYGRKKLIIKEEVVIDTVYAFCLECGNEVFDEKLYRETMSKISEALEGGMDGSKYT